MLANHKFFKIHQNIPSYAWTYIEAQLLTNKSELIIKSKIQSVEINNRKVAEPDWIEAAMKGCHKMINYLLAFQLIKKEWDIYVIKVMGNDVDTNLNAIECSSALATWKALSFAENELQIVYKDNRWRIRHQREIII